MDRDPLRRGDRQEVGASIAAAAHARLLIGYQVVFEVFGGGRTVGKRAGCAS
jgi:hypothetical protein